MEFKVNDEQRFKEFTARVRMQDVKQHALKHTRVKVYAKFEIEVIPTTDYSENERLKKQIRYEKDQEMQYVIVTSEKRVMYCEKAQFEFLCESLPDNWISLSGKRWQIRQTLKQLNIKWSKF